MMREMGTRIGFAHGDGMRSVGSAGSVGSMGSHFPHFPHSPYFPYGFSPPELVPDIFDAKHVLPQAGGGIILQDEGDADHEDFRAAPRALNAVRDREGSHADGNLHPSRNLVQEQQRV